MKFSMGKDNRKLCLLQRAIGGKVYTFDLLSGHTCPFARECKSKAVVRDDGSMGIQDGPGCRYRCFSASQEALYPNVYRKRADNTDAIRRLLPLGYVAIANALNKALPKDAKAIRIHVAGDFFHAKYFRAWCRVAAWNPNIVFYAYTKALPFLQQYYSEIPANFRITMSRGGTHDDLIHELKPLGFGEARVVYTEAEAGALEIDHDDSHSYHGGQDFALLIHGTQPKGSRAGRAVAALATAVSS